MNIVNLHFLTPGLGGQIPIAVVLVSIILFCILCALGMSSKIMNIMGFYSSWFIKDLYSKAKIKEDNSSDIWREGVLRSLSETGARLLIRGQHLAVGSRISVQLDINPLSSDFCMLEGRVKRVRQMGVKESHVEVKFSRGQHIKPMELFGKMGSCKTHR